MDSSFLEGTFEGSQLIRHGYNHLLLTRFTRDMARVTGATATGEECPLPAGYKLRVTNGGPIPTEPLGGMMFILRWCDSYVVEYAEQRVLSVENKGYRDYSLIGVLNGAAFVDAQ